MLSEDDVGCVEEYLAANPDWDWQLTDDHPLLSLIARSSKALQKLLDKYKHTRGKLGALYFMPAFHQPQTPASGLTPAVLMSGDLRKQLAAGRGGPRKPSAAVAQAMAAFKAPAERKPCAEAVPTDAAPADSPPLPMPDVVFASGRAVVVTPSIFAWHSKSDNMFYLAAPIFKLASGPHISVRDDNASLLVEWKWPPLSTIHESGYLDQVPFRSLRDWGLAAELENTPECTLSRIVPVLGGVTLKERLNTAKRNEDDEAVLVGYTTSTSRRVIEDKVDRPLIPLLACKPKPPKRESEPTSAEEDAHADEQQAKKQARAKFLADEESITAPLNQKSAD